MGLIDKFKEVWMSVPIMIATMLIGLALISEGVSKSYTVRAVTSVAAATGTERMPNAVEEAGNIISNYVVPFQRLGMIFAAIGVVVLFSFWDESKLRNVPIIMASYYVLQLFIMV